MTTTPLTDAKALEVSKHSEGLQGLVPADFARQLEQSLTTAQAAIVEKDDALKSFQKLKHDRILDAVFGDLEEETPAEIHFRNKEQLDALSEKVKKALSTTSGNTILERLEKAEKDTERLNRIEEYATYNGGGNGGTYTFKVTKDSECMRDAIDHTQTKG